MRDFFVLNKKVGETPLDVVRAYKAAHAAYSDMPMAYAGRLDPMASGLLLVLVGDACKQQEKYHELDKEYQFEVLFGVSSDTADVLGLLTWRDAPRVTKSDLSCIAKKLEGQVTMPYPHFSSRTVKGKPLHTWTLEGRLDEIEVPSKTSVIYKLVCTGVRDIAKHELVRSALEKIETIPPVTDERKALGADFRRTDVRADWKRFADDTTTPTTYQVASFICIASSGTYMRSLAEVIAKEAGTVGLAHAIHRSALGHYRKLPLGWGYWPERFLLDKA